eukprot:scaffold28036_cov56-Isochrysis_galbana.AAC.2
MPSRAAGRAIGEGRRRGWPSPLWAPHRYSRQGRRAHPPHRCASVARRPPRRYATKARRSPP